MSAIDQVLYAQTTIEKAQPALTSLKQSTEGMEASFLKQVVSMMRKSAGDVHFGKELGGDMYRDMFDQSIADTMAKKGVMGVGKAMFTSMAPTVIEQTISRNTAVHSMATTDSEDNER